LPLHASPTALSLHVALPICCDRSHLITSCNISRSQSARARPVRLRGPAENGQPDVVTDTPCQALVCATTSSAARQCKAWLSPIRSEEHTSELQSRFYLVCCL